MTDAGVCCYFCDKTYDFHLLKFCQQLFSVRGNRWKCRERSQQTVRPPSKRSTSAKTSAALSPPCQRLLTKKRPPGTDVNVFLSVKKNFLFLFFSFLALTLCDHRSTSLLDSNMLLNIQQSLSKLDNTILIPSSPDQVKCFFFFW